MQSVRELAEVKAKSLLVECRAGRIDLAKPDAVDLFLMMHNSSATRGLTDHIPVNWRREILFLLGQISDLPFHAICRVVGISAQRVFVERRRDRVLDDAVTAFQAAWYERQAEEPTSDLAPSLVQFGLKAKAGWRDQQLDALTPDQLRVMIDRIIGHINTHVPDAEVRARLGEAILADVELELGRAT